MAPAVVARREQALEYVNKLHSQLLGSFFYIITISIILQYWRILRMLQIVKKIIHNNGLLQVCSKPWGKLGKSISEIFDTDTPYLTYLLVITYSVLLNILVTYSTPYSVVFKLLLCKSLKCIKCMHIELQYMHYSVKMRLMIVFLDNFQSLNKFWKIYRRFWVLKNFEKF